jgi:hypothetical protein
MATVLCPPCMCTTCSYCIVLLRGAPRPSVPNCDMLWRTTTFIAMHLDICNQHAATSKISCTCGTHSRIFSEACVLNKYVCRAARVVWPIARTAFNRVSHVVSVLWVCANNVGFLLELSARCLLGSRRLVRQSLHEHDPAHHYMATT